MYSMFHLPVVVVISQHCHFLSIDREECVEGEGPEVLKDGAPQSAHLDPAEAWRGACA